MIEAVTTVCFVMLSAAAVLALYRLIVGPSILDRIIGFDMVAICIAGMIIVVSLRWQSALYIEIMLIFSLLGFLGTVAYVSFLASNQDKLRRDLERSERRKDKHS